MRNKQPIVARLIRGPLAGKTQRVKLGQSEIHWSTASPGGGKTTFRNHVYKIKWPEVGEATPAVVKAHYVGTRRR